MIDWYSTSQTLFWVCTGIRFCHVENQKPRFIFKKIHFVNPALFNIFMAVLTLIHTFKERISQCLHTLKHSNLVEAYMYTPIINQNPALPKEYNHQLYTTYIIFDKILVKNINFMVKIILLLSKSFFLYDLYYSSFIKCSFGSKTIYSGRSWRSP